MRHLGVTGRWSLIHTVPNWSSLEAVMARVRSLVKTDAASPYSVSLASAMTSSVSPNLVTDVTGPNTSVRTISSPCRAPTTTVGAV